MNHYKRNTTQVMGYYIKYSEDRLGSGGILSSPLPTVPNALSHPSSLSVPTLHRPVPHYNEKEP